MNRASATPSPESRSIWNRSLTCALPASAPPESSGRVVSSVRPIDLLGLVRDRLAELDVLEEPRGPDLEPLLRAPLVLDRPGQGGLLRPRFLLGHRLAGARTGVLLLNRVET